MTDMTGLQGGFGGFANTLTNENPQILNPQNLASMATENQAQQLAQAPGAEEIQCILNKFDKNFAYYRSGATSMISGRDPFISTNEAGKEVAKSVTMKSIETMMQSRASWESQHANPMVADIWNTRAKNVEVLGDFGEIAAVAPIGLYMGVVLDATGATITSLQCECKEQ